MPSISLPVQNIPQETFRSVNRQLFNYTVGFVRVEDTPTGQDAVLLGSGTLIKVGKVCAVLTAQHVLAVLPKEGRLGLILSEGVAKHTVEVQGLSYLDIASGTEDDKGPDIGAVTLSPAIAATLGSSKSFYELDNHRSRMLNNPPNVQEGIWANNGFVEELTITEQGRDGYSQLKGFVMYSGFGGPDSHPQYRDNFDYITLPVTYNGRRGIPKKFNGMSRGGLWQITLVTGPSGRVSPAEYLLSGVVFYQEPTKNNRGGITCYARRSVYEVASQAIVAGRA